MKIHPDNMKTALVLPGGGARGAFQVGVLRALAEVLPHGCVNPFPIISGTSAGAINTVVLASKARRFRVAMAELEKVWGHFHCDQVYRTDTLRMLKSSLHWFASIILGGMLVGTPRSLLDNSPLRSLLSQNVRFPRIQASIEAGHLHAVAVTAAGYGSSRSTTWLKSGTLPPHPTKDPNTTTSATAKANRTPQHLHMTEPTTKRLGKLDCHTTCLIASSLCCPPSFCLQRETNGVVEAE